MGCAFAVGLGSMGYVVEGMTVAEKQQASVWRDLIEPGWREREAERIAKFLAAVPMRQAKPCEWTNCPTRVGAVCCNDRNMPQSAV